MMKYYKYIYMEVYDGGTGTHCSLRRTYQEFAPLTKLHTLSGITITMRAFYLLVVKILFALHEYLPVN